MNEPLWIWIVFNLFIIALLSIDLFILHRQSKEMSLRHALSLSACWMTIALCFNCGLYFFRGKEVALNFLTGYLIEQSLSVDNLFVFILIFKYFKTPKQYQYRVLFWGIIGAIAMRALFIIFGVSLVNSYSWILYFFGAFLIYTGIKMATHRGEEIDLEKNVLLHAIKRWIPIVHEYHGQNFFIKKQGRLFATPLFLTLLTIESTDVIFALDSIPAIMAITLDPFIIYTSNIFAILGLRSLYFALAGLMNLFHYLHYALAVILIFVGTKMLIASWVHIPIVFSLGFIAFSLSMAIAASLISKKKEK